MSSLKCFKAFTIINKDFFRPKARSIMFCSLLKALKIWRQSLYTILRQGILLGQPDRGQGCLFRSLNWVKVLSLAYHKPTTICWCKAALRHTNIVLLAAVNQCFPSLRVNMASLQALLFSYLFFSPFVKSVYATPADGQTVDSLYTVSKPRSWI